MEVERDLLKLMTSSTPGEDLRNSTSREDYILLDFGKSGMTDVTSLTNTLTVTGQPVLRIMFLAHLPSSKKVDVTRIVWV